MLMAVPAPLGLPWYWRGIQNVQSMFGTTSAQRAATAGAIVAFGLLVITTYWLGRRLKDRYSPDAVEVVQSAVVTVSAVLISGFLVAVWRVSNEVLEALGFLSVTPEDGIKALVTLIVFAGGVTVTRLTKRSIKYGSSRVTITPHQREVAHHAIQIGVLVPTTMFVVALWGIPVSNIFLGAGVLGIVIGFAARKTLSGILSGFVILFSRPFEVGDWIRVSEREGIVTDITVYNTQIRTFNEEHVIVPNDTVTQNEVVNYSRTDRLRLETTVGVDYETDIDAAARVAVGAMERVDAVATQPPPDVIRQEFADSAIMLRLRYWITTPTVQTKWRAQNAVVGAVKSAFETEDIKIPFPQRELTGREEAGGVRIVDDRDGDHGADTGRATRRSGGRKDTSGPVEDDLGDRSEETSGGDAEGVAESIEESITDPPADEDAVR